MQTLICTVSLLELHITKKQRLKQFQAPEVTEIKVPGCTLFTFCLLQWELMCSGELRYVVPESESKTVNLNTCVASFKKKLF